MSNRYAIIFIDTEGGLEGPWREYQDFEEGIRQIAAILERTGVPAVFNACGKLLELYPDTFKYLESAGNEIALHGWKHENLRLLDNQWLDNVLNRSHEAFMDALGHPPHGFRAPWLEYDNRVLSWLGREGYLWVSHSHMFYKERFETPAARPEIRAGRKLSGLWTSWAERRFAKKPHRTESGLLELPLTSSMDGELLGLTSPLQPSPDEILGFALTAWGEQLKRAPDFFSLNLHDWLISSGNRLEVFEKAIQMLINENCQITNALKFIEG
jgi:peptidoglycan/xylan/chitin deacetylase (PgdA/CDA1 family)